jgi:hypothetical protein
MAEYDVYDIERRLKQYDDRILRIDFDHRRGLHRIICWDPIYYEEYTAMTVAAGQLDARVERRMMEINPKHFNAIADIDAARAQKERQDERKIEDMARDFADVFHKPLIRDAMGA